MLSTDDLNNTTPSMRKAEGKALRRQRREKSTWGHSAPSEPLCPNKSVGTDIESGVTTQLGHELVSLADKTRCAISESYAEVDRQRRNRDDATSRLEDLEKELARLTEENEERDCLQKKNEFKIKLRSLPSLTRRWSDLVHGSSEADDDGESSSSSLTGDQHFFPRQAIRRSCSMIYNGLQHSEGGASTSGSGSLSSSLSQHTCPLADAKAYTVREQLGLKLRNYALLEDGLIETIETNRETLSSIRNDISDLRSAREAAKLKSHVRALELREEIARLNADIQVKKARQYNDRVTATTDPLSHFMALDRDRGDHGAKQKEGEPNQQGGQQQQKQREIRKFETPSTRVVRAA